MHSWKLDLILIGCSVMLICSYSDGFIGLMEDSIGLDDLGPTVDGGEECKDEVNAEVLVPTSKKHSRGGNYSVVEDEALVLAWQNVSMDPMTRKDQPGSTYWQRI